MMMDKFTEKAHKAFAAGNEKAFLQNHVEVSPWHLLSALIEQDGGVVPGLFDVMNIDSSRVREVVDRQLQSLPSQEGGGGAHISSGVKKLIQGAFAEAQSLGDAYISTEHLLLALLEDPEVGSMATGMGIKRDSVLAALKTIRGDETP
jgi:ATP-dependent Clp protease ATP-binding subunit ClpB